MIQFTSEQLENYQRRLNQDESVLIQLRKKVQPLIERGVIIPDQGVATWTHYYYCSKHSVPLNFNLDEPHQHVCPVDKEVFSGEPYDGAWWRIVNEINAEGCYHFGLLWMLTRDPDCLERAKKILLEYAKRYPHYQVHGGIPYNGPGKANAQTLCEALWLKPLALGYDLIADSLLSTDKSFIENNLFTPGAEFLQGHRTSQIHNHEVIINTTIGILGILLNREDLIDFSVNAKYGLIYQLDKGVLKDGFWFEGSVGYHIFALEAFLAYEKFVYHTQYRLNHPRLQEMFQFPFKVIQPDFRFPLLNDMTSDEKNNRLEFIYEYGLSEYGNPEYSWLLKQVYQSKSRQESLEAFLYGVNDLPDTPEIELKDYHNPDGSGLTVFRGTHQQYLLVKHSPFGGEHDHYDRLGISYLAFGERITPDLGTTGYGAKLHYDYFKNTGSHNTVMINQENQPPANARVIRYIQKSDYILLDTEVKWDGTYPGLDSHTIVQWDEPSYAGVTMRRMILWCGQYFIEAFMVNGVKEVTIDWVLHVPGELNDSSAEEYQGIFSIKKPFKYLTNIRTIKPTESTVSNWILKNSQFKLYSYCGFENQIFYANGPDNPSTGDISYFINRVKGENALFINLFEVIDLGNKEVQQVDFLTDKGQITVKVNKDGVLYQYPISFEE